MHFCFFCDICLSFAIKDEFNLYTKVNNYYCLFICTAQPIFEHKGGNIPIGFFGHPFVLESSEMRHCIHGSFKVTILEIYK